MCTGHPPFRASGTHAVLKRVIEASPRPIREINDEIPDWLCDIIGEAAREEAGGSVSVGEGSGGIVAAASGAFAAAGECAEAEADLRAHTCRAASAGSVECRLVLRRRVRSARRAIRLGLLVDRPEWAVDRRARVVAIPKRRICRGHGRCCRRADRLPPFVIRRSNRTGDSRREAGATGATGWSRKLRWLIGPGIALLAYLLFIAGGYVFSDVARLYMLNMAEVEIGDVHYDQFDSFILTSDTSPEFANGFTLPAHLPLFVEPGKYRIRAVGRHGEKVEQWEIRTTRDALSVPAHQDGEECTLVIKRGQR